MLGLGPTELVIILVLVIFFYGGKRLGEVGEGLGKTISAFKKSIRDDSSQPAQQARNSSAEEETSGPERISDRARLTEKPPDKNGDQKP